MRCIHSWCLPVCHLYQIMRYICRHSSWAAKTQICLLHNTCASVRLLNVSHLCDLLSSIFLWSHFNLFFIAKLLFVLDTYILFCMLISHIGIYALRLNLTLHLVYVQIRIFILRWLEVASKLLLEISLSLRVSTIRLVHSVELQVFGTYAVHWLKLFVKSKNLLW